MNQKFPALYKILKTETTETNHVVSVEIDPRHEVFKGHFPDKPILPGVCQIEMVREISQQLLQKRLFMGQADQIKFLKFIDPTVDYIFQVNISFSGTKFSATIANQHDEFLKIKGVFSAEE